MSISSYYKENDKLIAEQKEERELLLAHGIGPDAIDCHHAEDYKAWKADRIYALHNSTSTDQLGEETLSLIRSCGTPLRESIPDGSFLDEISNEKLLAALRALKPDDLELVEFCLVNGFTQEEYAARSGKSQSAISKKLARVKAKLAAAIKK